MSEATVVPTDTRVKDAAVQLFGERGFAATGIRDIAEIAAISVASLYHYMDTKEDLLFSLMLDGMNSLLVPARQLSGTMGAVDKLSALVALHIDFHCGRGLLAHVTDTELRSLSDESRKQIVELRDEYEHLWRTVIDQGNKSGEFRVRDPKVTTLAAIGMCTSVYGWYSPAGPLSINEIADRYRELTLRMCGYEG